MLSYLPVDSRTVTRRFHVILVRGGLSSEGRSIRSIGSDFSQRTLVTGCSRVGRVLLR